MEATPGATDDGRDVLCIGRGAADGTHCCFVRGEVCLYLADNGEGAERRYECSLRRDLGSWEAVHADLGYQVNVQAAWDELGTNENGEPLIESCGSWQPPPGICCRQPRPGDTA